MDTEIPLVSLLCGNYRHNFNADIGELNVKMREVKKK